MQAGGKTLPLERVYDPYNQRPVEYYDSKDAKDTQERRAAKTINHRTFNNWIKSVLIGHYTTLYKKEYKEAWGDDSDDEGQRKGKYDSTAGVQLSVLDLACGKGGDLNKWKFAGIRNYCGVDISLKAVQDAGQRKLEMAEKMPKHLGFSATFIHQDCSVDPKVLFKDVDPNMCFDIVSCQFSMHYMFTSEEKVRNFLQIAASRLVKGGYFVCTHPDADVIVKKLRSKQTSFFDETTKCWISENDYYSIICETTEFPKSKGAYGFPYGFYLTDNLVGFKKVEADKEKLFYVPEYLVIINNLKKVCQDYGLEVVESRNMHEFFAEHIQNNRHKELFVNRIGFETSSNHEKLMEKDLWDTSYIYRVLAFKKVGGDLEQSDFDRSIFKHRGYMKIIKQLDSKITSTG